VTTQANASPAAAEIFEEALPEQIVLELIDQRPSNYFVDERASRDDWNDKDKRTARSAPSVYRLPTKSKILVYETDRNSPGATKKEWRVVHTRYIKGCPYIRVDDQVKFNFTPNYLADVIWVKDGKFIATKTVEDSGLWDYLTRGFTQNKDLDPQVDQAAGDPAFGYATVRPFADLPREFRIIYTKKEDIADAATYDMADKLTDYFRTIRYEKGGKTVYNREHMDFLCTLFKISGHEGGSASPGAYTALRQLATSNPRAFLESIADARSLVEVDVRKAILVGVITCPADDKKATLAKNRKVLMSWEGDVTQEDKIQGLIGFFAQRENSLMLDQIRIANRVADVQSSVPLL
jgi:hypothetical protein